ncbi:hypothetical protein PYK79_33060 [Streptomyces sp. ID05-04B]|uniref:hypothetical protein n=1 Tax=Streptomyces sp. P3 TaxID=2135430 RepID=UPI0020B13FEA|nr:hypothetical protein [Streptomyces sp. P3]MDX5567117.1 hypothetical protein [Streptomyces sp. ID05-04B]
MQCRPRSRHALTGTGQAEGDFGQGGPEVAYYRALFDDARTTALPPTESLTLIRRIAKEYRA